MNTNVPVPDDGFWDIEVLSDWIAPTVLNNLEYCQVYEDELLNDAEEGRE